MYVENIKDMYGDGKVTLDCVISVKRFDLKRVKLFYNKYQEKKSDQLTLPCTEHARANKQLFFCFSLLFSECIRCFPQHSKLGPKYG